MNKHTEELREYLAEKVYSAAHLEPWEEQHKHVRVGWYREADKILSKLEEMNYQKVLRVGAKMTKGKNGMEIGGVQYCEPIEL